MVLRELWSLALVIMCRGVICERERRGFWVLKHMEVVIVVLLRILIEVQFDFVIVIVEIEAKGVVEGLG